MEKKKILFKKLADELLDKNIQFINESAVKIAKVHQLSPQETEEFLNSYLQHFQLSAANGVKFFNTSNHTTQTQKPPEDELIY